MPTSSPELAHLLLEWQEQRRLGKPVTAEQLCADAPELLVPLKQQIAAIEAAERVGITLTVDGHNAPSTQSREQLTGSFDSDRTTPPLIVPTQTNRLAPPGYELLAELGRGGMGVVYKALQVKAKRVVALKMILSGAYASQKDLERFRIEGESVARLQHINIVQVFDVGEHDGKPYFALEFCEGGNLASKLAGTPLPAREAAELVEKLANAIAEAHAKGIIHRDLKPANVLLTLNGEPKVTDFGLAKQFDSEPREAATQRVSGAERLSVERLSVERLNVERLNVERLNVERLNVERLNVERSAAQTLRVAASLELTATGAVMGTPSYMAPEQATGDTKRVGTPCDIYALGAILYECLTGRPPFKGASMVETLDQVRKQEPVPPSQLNPKVPRDLETICLKCLRKEPEKRYQAARGLADDVRRYLDGKPIVARAVGRGERAVKWVKRNPVVTGATLAVVLALAVGASVSYVKYRDAQRQKEIAEDRRKDAQKSEADAVAARNDVENANDNLVTTMARSLLRTLAVQVRSNQLFPGLNDPEIAALWEVGSTTDERLRSRFLAEAPRDPLAMRQLTDRAAFALQAAVGLDETRRAQVEELFGRLLLAKESAPEQKENLAICLSHLGVRDRSLAEKTVATLTQAMSKTFEPFRLQQLSESLLAMAARMEPKEAAAALTQAMSKTTDAGGVVKRPLAQGLSAASARMEPKEAAAALSLVMSQTRDPRALLALAQGLSAAAARMEPKTAAQLCGQAAATFTRAMSTSITAEASRDLAQGLAALAAHMELKEANRACGQAAANLNLAMTRTPHIPWLLHFSEGLLAVAIRMEPKEANQAYGQAAATLIKAVNMGFGNDLLSLSESLSELATRMEPREAAAILTQAMQSFPPQQVQFFNSDGPTPFDSLSKGFVAVATRMEPKEAAEAAAALSAAISKTTVPRTLAGLSQGLSVVAARMDSKDAAQVCGQAAATLTQTMSKTPDPIALASIWKGLSALATRMEPKEAVATFTRSMSKNTDPRALAAFAQCLTAAAARMEPKEAATNLISAMSMTTDPPALAALAQGLSAVAARMGPKDAAQVCGQVAADFTMAMSKTTDPYALRSLAQGLSALAAHMDSRDAAGLCGQTAAKLTESINKTTASLLSSPRRTDSFDLSETRPLNVLQMLSEGLSALAARMDPRDAAQLCGQVAATFTAAMSKSTDPNAFVFFSDLAAGLSALAVRMEPKEAAQLCGQAAAAINLASSKLSSAPTILQSLSERLSALAPRMEPKEAATTLIQAMSRLSAANPNESAFLKPLSESLSAVVVREAAPLPPQTLVDILKHPFCVGEPRRLVLEQLSRHYNRPFADPWDFVEYVNQNKINLEFTTPPERPRQAP